MSSLSSSWALSQESTLPMSQNQSMMEDFLEVQAQSQSLKKTAGAGSKKKVPSAPKKMKQNRPRITIKPPIPPPDLEEEEEEEEEEHQGHHPTMAQEVPSITPKSSKKPNPKKRSLQQEMEDREISDGEEDEGEEQGIQIPTGHMFLGDWRGVSVKQSFGSIVLALHIYKMKKSLKTGGPMTSKDGKILTTTSKIEFCLKEQELVKLYKALPTLIAMVRKETEQIKKYKAEGRQY